jgi:maleylpyruvate isomerase
MAGLSSGDLVLRMKGAHARERSLIRSLTDDQVRAASALPGWTRGHVLGSRLAFVRAATRQIQFALAGQQIELFDGGRSGRDAEIAAHADRGAADLVRDLLQAVAILEESVSRVGPADWYRPVTYRDQSTVMSIVQASWREAEVHCVDLDLGAQPSDWSAEFCAHLFDFLAERAPEGVQIELAAPGGDVWILGAGVRVTVVGAVTDLAAWLAGREAVGPVTSSTGTLPALRRLREARRS